MLWELATRRQLDEALLSIEPHLRRAPMLEMLLDDCDVPVGSLDSVALSRVRPTVKRDFRETHFLERSVPTDAGRLILGSSGTSGPPTLYCWTLEDLRHVGEVTRPFRSALGMTSGDVGAVWAPTERSVMGQAMLSEFLSDGCCVHVLGAVEPDRAHLELRAVGASIIKGLPGPLSGLGAMRGESLSIRQAHVGGDLLTSCRRAAIEAALGCDCYNFYGLSEVYGPLAAECREKQGMHLLEGDVLVELLDPRTLLPAPAGSIGVAVFTSLWPKTAPVVRYWSDDLFEVLPGACSCGSATPRLLYHGRYIGHAYDRGDALSLLTVEATLDEFTSGLQSYSLILGDESARLSLGAAGQVDEEGLARELAGYLGVSTAVEVASEAVSRPKMGQAANLRSPRGAADPLSAR